MTVEEFKNRFIVDVRILIHNKEECYRFQEIAFKFGVRVHSTMDIELQQPIAYNIADIHPEYTGKSFAKNMHNLVIYDNGARLQQSGFYGLEKDKKEITFEQFIEAYNQIQY